MSAPDPQDAIGLCLAGRLSPEVAIARLLLGGLTPDSLAGQIAERRPAEDGAEAARHWAALTRLVQQHRGALANLAAEISDVGSNHEALAQDGIAGIAAFFDRQVARSPEASVALYSLADPAILSAATEEIMRWIESEQLLPPDADVLDLGCGIGRVSAALAPRCRTVLGLDVSPGMVAEAQKRCAQYGNVLLRTTSGNDLDALPTGGLTTVLAVDSFPYIVQAGPDVVARNVAGISRALRPGGRLIVLNLSYRQDGTADQADAASWCDAYGFTLDQAGTHPFRLWDASAFVLRRTG